jgi:two-component system OmpR family response regulator
MEPKERIAIYPLDVYVVTDAGQEELKRGSTTLSPQALELLVLMDGLANVREITERAQNLSEREVGVLLPKLIIDGFAKRATIAAEDGMDFSYFFDADKPAPEPSGLAKEQAEKEADTGAPALQHQGYYVSIARRAARPRQPADGAKLSVLVVEDDPQLCEVLRNLMRLQGFLASTAMNRGEVLAALRRLPSPDLVLLDVRLPDANGFDILQRMKQHPVLKAIAVIMLTGEASRESVMRGLAGGADGYVTKPFETEILVKGVKSVLGLA